MDAEELPLEHTVIRRRVFLNKTHKRDIKRSSKHAHKIPTSEKLHTPDWEKIEPTRLTPTRGESFLIFKELPHLAEWTKCKVEIATKQFLRHRNVKKLLADTRRILNEILININQIFKDRRSSYLNCAAYKAARLASKRGTCWRFRLGTVKLRNLGEKPKTRDIQAALNSLITLHSCIYPDD